MLSHKEYKALMGKLVTATGDCGMGKGKVVTGILSEHKDFGMPLVTVTSGNPSRKEVYSVIKQTIKKA